MAVSFDIYQPQAIDVAIVEPLIQGDITPTICEARKIATLTSGEHRRYTPRFVSIIHKLLNAESEWNPKVIVGRVVTTLLPERVAITLFDVGGWRIDSANLR